MVQWVWDPALSRLWHGFWPWDFPILWVQPSPAPQKKKKPEEGSWKEKNRTLKARSGAEPCVCVCVVEERVVEDLQLLNIFPQQELTRHCLRHRWILPSQLPQSSLQQGHLPYPSLLKGSKQCQGVPIVAQWKRI